MEIRVIECDDWCWLYINGKTDRVDGEGHELDAADLIKCINHYLSNNYDALKKIDYKTMWVSDDYVEDQGGDLPEMLTDIPKEAFE